LGGLLFFFSLWVPPPPPPPPVRPPAYVRAYPLTIRCIIDICCTQVSRRREQLTETLDGMRSAKKLKRSGTRDDARQARIKGQEPYRTDELSRPEAIKAWAARPCGAACKEGRNCRARLLAAVDTTVAQTKFVAYITTLMRERLARITSHRVSKTPGPFTHAHHLRELHANPSLPPGVVVCFQVAAEAHGHTAHGIAATLKSCGQATSDDDDGTSNQLRAARHKARKGEKEVRKLGRGHSDTSASDDARGWLMENVPLMWCTLPNKPFVVLRMRISELFRM
jgi:hypothetical protein